MSNLTRELSQIGPSEPAAAAALLPLVYDELRKLAADRLRSESPGQTLQATALVHEAYLRLIQQKRQAGWDSRGHFFAAAAEAMRRILVENARRKKRLKHGGGQRRNSLEAAAHLAEQELDDLVALDAALERLAALAPEKAELVKLRYFAGLTLPQIAAAMSISLATAERYWAFARTWLYAELRESDDLRTELREIPLGTPRN